MDSKSNHLSLWGVGPIFIIFCLLCTLIAFLLKDISFFQKGKVREGNILFILLGIFFILFSLLLWIQSVFIERIREKIKQDKLVTSGVYSKVRNPIYSAFLFLFTAILLLAQNYFLLIFPFLFWLFLTLLLKYTEEIWLKRRFGKEYLLYCQRVNRIFPSFRKK